ncbi:MAG: hypothetical protein PGN29_00830 [Gordonia paraffinivorans]
MQQPWRPALRSGSGAVALEWWTPTGSRTGEWWVEAYAQRIARIADAQQVCVHHLDDGLVLVEVVAPSRVGPDPTDLARGPAETRVPMAGQVTCRGDVLATSSDATIGGRAVLVTAHRPEHRASRRSALVDRVIPALHSARGVRAVRAHLTDGRHGESVLGDVVVVEARDADSACSAVRAVVDEMGPVLDDPRVHRVSATQILREDGRPLLPADRTVAKPRLDPRRRPTPAARTGVADDVAASVARHRPAGGFRRGRRRRR